MTGSGGNLPSPQNPEAAAFIEKLFLGITVAGVLGMVLITIRSIFYGSHAENLAQILLYLVFLCIVVFRKRMTPFQSVFTSIGVCWAFSFLALYSWGFASQGFLILVVAFTASAVFFGRVGVLILTFFSSLFFLVIIEKFVHSKGIVSLDMAGFSKSRIGWGLEIFVLAAVIGFLALLLQQYSQSLREKMRLLKEKENELENEGELRAETLRKQDAVLKERETLIEEVTSRVHDNLHVMSSLIQYQALSVNSDKARDILMDIKSRIYGFSILHREIVQKEGDQLVYFGRYMGEIARVLAVSRRMQNLKVEFPDKETLLCLDTALPCSLIAYEVLSMMVKNLNSPGEGENVISLGFHRRGFDSYFLSMESEDVDLIQVIRTGEESLGFSIVKQVCDSLKAHYQFSTVKGARFQMVFQEYREAGADLF